MKLSNSDKIVCFNNKHRDGLLKHTRTCCVTRKYAF